MTQMAVAAKPQHRNDQPTQAAPAGAITEPVTVDALNPADEAGWHRCVLDHPRGSLFHTLTWSRAVCEVFPHEPVHLVARRGQHVAGILPLFEVRSLFTGRQLISVPYGVLGGPIGDETATAALVTAAKQMALSRACDGVEFRTCQAVMPDQPIVHGHFSFRRQLPAIVEQLPEWLPRKARAVVRQARDRYRLEVRFGDEYLPQVWRLYARNMRRLGSIAYPSRFFHALAAATASDHWTAVVMRDGQPLAGVLSFLFKGAVMPYFFGAHAAARRVGAANYLYFALMQRGVTEGFSHFDFGRTRESNRGSLEFKRLQGFTPVPLEYQRISVNGRPARVLAPDDRPVRIARRLWSVLPLCVVTRLGAHLSRHIPG